MANMDTTKDEDKGTWRKRFVKRLEKVIDDDAYNEQQKNKAKGLKENIFYFLNIDSFAS